MSELETTSTTETNDTEVSEEAKVTQETTAETTTASEEKKAPSILGKQEEAKATEAAEPVKLDFTELAKELGVEIDQKKNEAFKELLLANGVTNQEQANNLTKFGLQYAGEQMQEMMIAKNHAMFDETVKHYGGTPENPGERFEAAVGKAGKALEHIEKTIPGIRDALEQSGVDCSLPMVQLFEMLGDMVGEDGNFATGGTAAGQQVKASDFFPNTK